MEGRTQANYADRQNFLKDYKVNETKEIWKALGSVKRRSTAKKYAFIKALLDEKYEVLNFHHLSKTEMYCFCILLLNYNKLKYNTDIRPLFDITYKKFLEVRLKADYYYKEAFGVPIATFVGGDSWANEQRRNKEKISAEQNSE